MAAPARTLDVETPPAPFAPPAEFDDYVILRPLGEGAMGRVYLAEDTVLARHVAIKFIAAGEPDLQARQRFLMEARAVARIQHPNVLTIHRVGELGDRPYLVTELVRGDLLSRLPRPMAPDRALAIATDLARGLAAAHRGGVLHCDIKPDNVMVDVDGMAKLVDFGLARMVHDDGAPTGMTGTRDYLAPELWQGRPPSRRTDVYALGALLHELVAGAPPFADVPLADLARAVCERDPPALATEPDLAALIAGCLTRDPGQRFAGGEAVREAIERLHAARMRTGRVDENPYRGLRPFEAAHRCLFFGRDAEIGELLERLRTDPMVVVAGDSGVGKSSLVRAGVVPAVIGGALGGGRPWQAVTAMPGRGPLTSLAAVLDDPALPARITDDPEALARALHARAAGGGVLLFIDQLEELVTIGDRAQVSALDRALACLCERASAVRVIATVRADFLSRLVELPHFGREVARVLTFIRPLAPERLRDVITGPAAATGVGFESEAMIDELVAATASAGGGGLPLLSFALAELWAARDRAAGVITRASLDAIGGVAGALARHGDAVLARMSASERLHARKALLRLVTTDGTRAPRGEAELTVGPDTRAALDALVTGRLLIARDGAAGATYELAHEALIRGWGTLRDWLTVESDDRARRERLAEAAAAWAQARRAADLVWQGPRLAAALALDRSHLTTLEREFVDASARAARRRRRTRSVLIVGVLALLVAVYVGEQQLANRRLARAVGDELRAAHRHLASARAGDRERRAEEAAALTAFDGGAADAEERWQRVLARRATTLRAYRAASARIEAALAKDPGRADVRGLLGDILLERAELADASGDGGERDELLERLAAYDPDGTRRRRWTRPGQLVVRAPDGATVAIDGQPARNAAIVGELAPGPHLIEVRADGRRPLREPILLARGEQLELDLTPPRSVPAGMVYVPAGRFLSGSADDEETRRSFLTTWPLHPRRTGAYLIARDEVTVAEWLAFVDDQPAADRAALLPDIPARIGGGVRLAAVAGGYRLTLSTVAQVTSAGRGEPMRYPGRDRRAAQDWTRFPVLGVTAIDAVAYARWMDRTGRLPGARLCDELEWERAARGADGRAAPGGAPLDGDDANLDLTYGREWMGPDEVGAHAASTSPYGLADTAGNAFEWTAAAAGGGYVLRGGSYYHDRKTADLANRNAASPTLREASAGLRLCATAP